MRTLFFLPLLGMVTACDPAPQTSADVEPDVMATVEVRIGALDGPAPYVFGRITGIAATSELVMVADGQADIIQAYDWDGEYQFTVARQGSGPGEVRRPCCLAIGPDGFLWVRDNGNRRYNGYEVAASASFNRSVRMAHGNFSSVPPSFGPDGVLIDVGSSRLDGGESVRTRFLLDENGEEVGRQIIPAAPQDSVPTHIITRAVEGGVTRMVFPQPLGPRQLVAHAPNGDYAVAVSSAYAVRWVGPTRTFETLLTAELQGPEVTSFERDSVRAMLAEQLRASDLTIADFPFDVAERKPVIEYLQFDGLGRLWVHLTPGRVGPRMARVHDRSGDVVLVIGWPREIDLRGGYVGDGVALGIQTDSLGVQRVVRLAF